MNPYEPAPTSPPPTGWWHRFFCRPSACSIEPQRLLDDVANAVHQTRVHLTFGKTSCWPSFQPRLKRRIIRSMGLDDQFSPFSRDQYLPLLWKSLDCPCPKPLDGCTIQQVVDQVVDAGLLGERVHADHVTEKQWVNAQIFAGVQAITIEQCGIAKEKIYRSARFLEDLDCC